MYYLSWCTNCVNNITIFINFLSALFIILFSTVFGYVLANFIFKKFIQPKKIKFSYLILLVMTIVFAFLINLCIIPILSSLSAFVSKKVFVVDPKYKGYISDKLPNFNEIVEFNKDYFMTWLLAIPLFSYLYFTVVGLMKKKKKNKYVVIGVYVVGLILLIVLFILGHEYIINNMESFYTCSNVC